MHQRSGSLEAAFCSCVGLISPTNVEAVLEAVM
jgi:hypothetical protein